MTTQSAFAELTMPRGPAMPNRLALAPLTNAQSEEAGPLSDDELAFLSRRAEGGFGMVMTCAAYVAKNGQGFARQLGVASDDAIAGLIRLSRAVRAMGGVSAVQLQHSGLKAKSVLTGEQPVAPWDDPNSGARALTTAEVEELIEAFVMAGLRAERAGIDGVELHAAHGYLIGQFLDSERNQRRDGYGGTFAQRCRVLWAIIRQLRARTGPSFQIGVRLSPERYGMALGEVQMLAEGLMTGGDVDYVDMSLWDVLSAPDDAANRDLTLLELFAPIGRGNARLGVAGKIMSGATINRCLDQGADFVLLGRAAILHHDFPRRLREDASFKAADLPISRDHLAGEGVGPLFVDYLAKTWPGFVADSGPDTTSL